MRPVETELLHAAREIRRDEANSGFSQFCERDYKSNLNVIAASDRMAEYLSHICVARAGKLTVYALLVTTWLSCIHSMVSLTCRMKSDVINVTKIS